jgi:tetratricopeptide (TPR) repeat protein
MHVATLFVNAGEMKKAKKYFKHALKLDPENIEAHFSLGRLLHNTTDDYLEPLEYYNFVIDKDPKHHKALCQLGILYCEK